MKLFDELHRKDDGPRSYTEPQFHYLNHSARTDVGRIRQLLKKWFVRYPSQHQTDLLARFRSSDDSQHRSAFFELFLHELLLKLNCHIAVHPGADKDGIRRPDFFVESSKGHNFYMEAVLATDESKDETAARTRESVVYDVINRMHSPNFFIGMNVKGAPQTPPPAKEIRRFLEEKLKDLNPDQLGEMAQKLGLESLPRWNYSHDGWEIEFYPIPKSPAVRGKPGIRPIGIQSDDVHEIDARTAIRDAILAKAGRYGKVKIPYIIAVNALGEHVDRIDIMEALFGKEQIVVKFGHFGPKEHKMTRKPDGVWRSLSGPIYTRVSGVIITTPVLPWNIPRANICLYHNPWAALPYTCELTSLPQVIPKDKDHMEWQVGRSLTDIFGLPSKWPEI